ncbi:MAG TPA: hydrogen gas-evolving membrane-bound hydrogenase subunit E [Solirubrobacteraceae bacterium]|nr:hydrogen gas-evolving membrane-bound hydrogenase subunit E [Solirubrobacteraceae bacterium]
MRTWAPPATVLATAGAGFVALLWLWLAGGGGEVDASWAPTLDMRLHLRLDGLAAMYALMATGLAVPVFLFAWRYLPHHLAEQGRTLREQPRFYALLGLFMIAMVGLALAQDLILLFVFWDLTAVASYLLIGYDRQEPRARRAALMALLVTAITAVALLIGALVLYERYGTFSLPELFRVAQSGTTVTVAVALITVAALAKSAQVPFHFWLARAMVAPTPVSAYLHSAAMVAAGVLLIGRVYPLLERSPVLLDALVVAGFASMLVGGVLALTRDDLKQVLAYSTFSQYGYVVFLYGLGGEAGVGGAAFYVVTHAVAKCALFLAAGAVTRATGAQRLSELGGLGRRMPVVAGGSLACAATVASLPLTVGFFADELLFKAALERGGLFAAMALLIAALTLAYMVRFWTRIFLGAPRGEAHPVPATMVVPIGALGALALVGGLVPAPFVQIAQDAAAPSLLSAVPVKASYHLDLRAENLLALATFALGALVYAGHRALPGVAGAVAEVGRRLGPERWYTVGLAALNRLSDRTHDLEVRDFRGRVTAILLPTGVLFALAFVVTPTLGAYAIGSVSLSDLPLVLMLGFTASVAVAATRPHGHLTMVLTLGSVGFSLAVVYALLGAPNVALVAVLVETVLALLFVGVLSLIPRDVLRDQMQAPRERRGTRFRDPAVGLVAGATVFLLVWSGLTRTGGQSDAARQLTELAPEAHADNVVTAILTDLRALDTLGEITVIAVALLGVTKLLRRGRLW